MTHFRILLIDAVCARDSVFARMPELFPKEDLSAERIADLLGAGDFPVHVPLAMYVRRERELERFRDRISILVEARELRPPGLPRIPVTGAPLTALARNRSDEVIVRVFQDRLGCKVRCVQALAPAAETPVVFLEEVLLVAGTHEHAPGWSLEELELWLRLGTTPDRTQVLLPFSIGGAQAGLPRGLARLDRWLLGAHGPRAHVTMAFAFFFWSFFRRGLLTPTVLHGVVWRRWFVGTLYWKLLYGLFFERFCRGVLARVFGAHVRGFVWRRAIYGGVYWKFCRGVLARAFGAHVRGAIWRRAIYGGLYWKFGRGFLRARVWPVVTWPLRKVYWFCRYQLETRFAVRVRR